MKKTLLILPLTLIMLFVLAVPVLAQGPNGDGSRVLFGQNLTLQAEETIRGDVVVFGGNLNAMEGSTIEGDVVIFGGNATITGSSAWVSSWIKITPDSAIQEPIERSIPPAMITMPAPSAYRPCSPIWRVKF